MHETFISEHEIMSIFILFSANVSNISAVVFVLSIIAEYVFVLLLYVVTSCPSTTTLSRFVLVAIFSIYRFTTFVIPD